MSKKKAIDEMSLWELLKHYPTTIDEDGNTLDGHEETIEAIMREWPFCEITDLRGRVDNLEDEVQHLKNHVHLPDGSVAVKIK